MCSLVVICILELCPESLDLREKEKTRRLRHCFSGGVGGTKHAL